MTRNTAQEPEQIENSPSRQLPQGGGLTRRYARLAGLGLSSLGLYFLLYWFNGDIKDLAQVTNAGDKSLFFVPILVALVFSFIHGAFTSQFWDALGVKAKNR